MRRLAFTIPLLFPLVLLAAQQAKLPVPSSSDQKKAEKVIRSVYGAEFRSKDADRLRKLAKALMEEAADEANDAASRYVLLRESQEVAAGVGDTETALAAVDGMEAIFAVDGAGLRADVLNRARKSVRTPEDAAALAAVFLAAAEKALEAGDHDGALDLARDGERTAKAARSAPLVSRARVLVKEIPELKREAGYVEKTDLSEAIDVGDTRGNLNVGRHLCFVKGEWEQGLEFLLWSGDRGTKEVAEKELAKPSTTSARLEVADGWLDLADKQRSDLQEGRYQSRALYWYQIALGEARGLARRQIEQKLAELHRKGVRARGGHLGAGLLAAWNLDERSGLKASDSSGNGNHGTLENIEAEEGAPWVAGDPLTSRAFQSSGDAHIRSGGSASWNRIDRAVTVAAWINLGDDPDDGQCIVSRRQGEGGRQHFALGVDEGALVALLATAEGNAELKSTGRVTPGTWAHVALTYDGSTARLYLDGKEVLSQPASGTFTNDENPVIIGGMTENGKGLEADFAGRIARVRIYTRALSAGEISGLHLGDR